MNSIRDSRNGKSVGEAFTLVELLVVVAIIGLLISLVLPAASSSLARARSVGCLSNLRQYHLGLTLYAVDNGGRVPRSGDYFYFKGVRPYVGGPDTTKAYLGRPEPAVFSCPEAGRRALRDFNADIVQVTYGYPVVMLHRKVNNPALADQQRGRNLGSFKTPATSVALLDVGTRVVQPGSIRYVVASNSLTWQLLQLDLAHPNGSANAVFIDGHAANSGVDQWAVEWTRRIRWEPGF
ncbi:MAG: type II secretion system GspH family protein [Candidatus Marinimicrobia bacterium]|nr:type II secretion system GspH family protein [Candidatus Neomarinimicrobiota bacterium]